MRIGGIELPRAQFAALSLLLCVAMPRAAHAADGARSGSWGLGVGTGGLGVDYAYPLHRRVDLRAGYDFGNLKYDTEEDDVDYEGKLKLSAARLMVDLKPFGGGFRISAGLYTGTPELELHARGSDNYEIGNNEYNADARIDGKVDLGGAAPYLGIGWGGTTSARGFGASFDVGVIFTGSPGVKLRVPSGRACVADDNEDCDPAIDGFEVNDGSADAQTFQANVELERQELEDDAKDVKLWPIVRLGLHYRF